MLYRWIADVQRYMLTYIWWTLFLILVRDVVARSILELGSEGGGAGDLRDRFAFVLVREDAVRAADGREGADAALLAEEADEVPDELGEAHLLRDRLQDVPLVVGEDGGVFEEARELRVRVDRRLDLTHRHARVEHGHVRAEPWLASASSGGTRGGSACRRAYHERDDCQQKPGLRGNGS